MVKKGGKPNEAQLRGLEKGRYKGAKKIGFKMSEETKKKTSETLKKNRHIYSERYKGSKSPLWKGGVTEKNALIRMSLEFKMWREAVFKRDGGVCQKCGSKEWINPHHIFNFAQHVDKRFEVDNGITLCRKHHREFHSIYGRKDNNLQQLNEFLGLKRLGIK